MRRRTRSALTKRLAVLAVLVGLPSASRAAPPEPRTLALPEAPYRYADPKLPANFEERRVQALDTTPTDNPTTDAGATLGRVLFYDTWLSASATASCGSRHVQKHAFAEPRAVSVGHEGGKGDRNAMSLVNLRWARAGLFWDERAATLEEAAGLPAVGRREAGSEVARTREDCRAEEAAPVPADEFAELGCALDRLAGGFGQAAPDAIDMAQFTRRFVAYDPAGKGAVAVVKLPERLHDFASRGDRDRDGTLSLAEIEAYIRASAFSQLLAEGIYAGGGFADALVRHVDLLGELKLPDETRKAEALFAEHDRKVKAVTAEAATKQFAQFRDTVGKKAPPPAKR